MQARLEMNNVGFGGLVFWSGGAAAPARISCGAGSRGSAHQASHNAGLGPVGIAGLSPNRTIPGQPEQLTNFPNQSRTSHCARASPSTNHHHHHPAAPTHRQMLPSLPIQRCHGVEAAQKVRIGVLQFRDHLPHDLRSRHSTRSAHASRGCSAACLAAHAADASQPAGGRLRVGVWRCSIPAHLWRTSCMCVLIGALCAGRCLPLPTPDACHRPAPPRMSAACAARCCRRRRRGSSPAPAAALPPAAVTRACHLNGMPTVGVVGGMYSQALRLVVARCQTGRDRVAYAGAVA